MSIGMLVHEASVLIVIVNAMRLLRRHGPDTAAAAPSSMAPLNASAEDTIVRTYISRGVATHRRLWVADVDRR